MKPNYDKMTNAQLRAYILQYRNDLDAMEAFLHGAVPMLKQLGFILPKSQKNGISK
jgi:hypothetical protein